MPRKGNTQRFFHISYVNLGYTYEIDDNGCQVPVCIICGMKRSPNSMTPGKLGDHFEIHVSKGDALSADELMEKHLNNMDNNLDNTESLETSLQKLSSYISFQAAFIATKGMLTCFYCCFCVHGRDMTVLTCIVSFNVIISLKW